MPDTLALATPTTAPGPSPRPASARFHWGRWSTAAVGILLLAWAVVAWGVPFVFGPMVQAVRAERLEIVQTVVASGRVASPARIAIGSQTTGQVAAVPVVEGQIVQADQVLVRLEDADARAAVEQARAAVALAEARLGQLRDLTLPVAEQARLGAEANHSEVLQQWTRTEELLREGIASQADLDTANRGLQIANSELETARLRLQAVQPGGADLGIALGDLRQANASLQAAQANLDHTTIRAPVGGTLIARTVERGDIVLPGQVLMELSPTGKTQLVVQIDEKNLRHLAIGQPALAAADAWPERRFQARLVFVNPGIDASRGSVEVKLDAIDPPDVLRQDMTVSVDIEVARLVAATSLPPLAVHDAAGKAPWVLVVVDGHAKRREVQLGARGDTHLEVRDGLVEGEVVLLEGSAPVTAGRRVRAQLQP